MFTCYENILGDIDERRLAQLGFTRTIGVGTIVKNLKNSEDYLLLAAEVADLRLELEAKAADMRKGVREQPNRSRKSTTKAPAISMVVNGCTN
ncbi:hypothetical protein V496_00060 [Pseudogymnoascus sp. VKM F-4515 (FW-2607)]|nr:hypothetical protein V496_00060 [Pseudogymnoascus sp. VKM F-4515 (FW-2607)]